MKTSHPMVTVYVPDRAIRQGFVRMLRDIIHEFYQNRWLMAQLFKREVLTIYKQSFMGVLWIFVLPVMSVGTFSLLRRSGIVPKGPANVPYPVYAMLGVMFWQIFAAGLVAGTNSLVKAGSMIIKINFSKKALVVAATTQALVAFLIQIVVFGSMCAWYHVTLHPAVVFLPLLLLPLFLLTLGLGFVLSILNGIMRDIGQALSLLLTFLMLLTPVLYEVSGSGALASFNRFNILYYLISTPREVVLWGTMSEWKGFLAASIVAGALGIVSLILFHITETRVAERI